MRIGLFVLLAAACPADAANPYFHFASGEPVVTRWEGSEWGDELGVSDQRERPFAATVTSRRLAQMHWGQIVRMRFDADCERRIAPIYLLVRDDVILELVDEDMEYLIGVIAVMAHPPNFDPKDVRGSTREGKRDAPGRPGGATVTTGNGTSTYLWSHPSGHFRKLVFARHGGIVEYAVGTGARRDGFRLFPAPPSDILGDEKLGGLAIGMDAPVVRGLIGEPRKSSQAHVVAATGEWCIEQYWPHLGLSTSMSAPKAMGPWKISSVTVEAPSRLATAKGIRIGSREADVVRAYAGERCSHDSVAGRRFVAGSIHGGMIFDIKRGVVSRIFMGAAAE